jgi:hypothetical protein
MDRMARKRTTTAGATRRLGKNKNQFGDFNMTATQHFKPPLIIGVEAVLPDSRGRYWVSPGLLGENLTADVPVGITLSLDSPVSIPGGQDLATITRIKVLPKTRAKVYCLIGRRLLRHDVMDYGTTVRFAQQLIADRAAARNDVRLTGCGTGLHDLSFIVEQHVRLGSLSQIVTEVDEVVGATLRPLVDFRANVEKEWAAVIASTPSCSRKTPYVAFGSGR